jgi:4-alpha-glucanotransferase
MRHRVAIRVHLGLDLKIVSESGDNVTLEGSVAASVKDCIAACICDDESLRSDLLSRLAAKGVSGGFVNVAGAYVTTPTRTLALIDNALCCKAPRVTGDPLIATPGRYHPELFGTLVTASGRTIRAVGSVNEVGYHTLYTLDGARRLVIAAPDRLPTPARGWGWQLQLYAARTQESWGIGDFRDLMRVCHVAATQGASCVQISPVHAFAPISRPQGSPYSPASRQFLNLLHVAPGLAPGAELVDLSDLAVAGRALNDTRQIDRDAVWALKRAALQRVWSHVSACPPSDFIEWKDAQGHDLWRFATWSVIAERQDTPDWQSWPAELRDPTSAAVAEFAQANYDEVLFHCWCQWVAALQLDVACHSGVDVVIDTAVAFDLNSGDAWEYQHEVCSGFEIGAPPDAHNAQGQHWGLAPFSPTALEQADFKPFIAMVRSALASAGAMRIEHVMKLWRLYWVPKGLTATDGAYVYYNVDALLAILRVEAATHGAWIVGEDIGTVASGVRETMEIVGMLQNRSAMRTPIADFPELGVGVSSTHDQVTVAGLITGSDEDALNRTAGAGFVNVSNTRAGLAELAHIDPAIPGDQLSEADIRRAVVTRYKLLATAPSRIVLVNLDDAAMVRERPNMPGTVDEYPNWRLALPQPVDAVMASPLVHDLVELMNARI